MVGAWEADPLIEGVTEVTDPETEKEASHGVPDPLHEHDLDVHDLLETCSNCSSEHSLNHTSDLDLRIQQTLSLDYESDKNLSNWEFDRSNSVNYDPQLKCTLCHVNKKNPAQAFVYAIPKLFRLSSD